jgi:hypothetical protein
MLTVTVDYARLVGAAEDTELLSVVERLRSEQQLTRAALKWRLARKLHLP